MTKSSNCAGKVGTPEALDAYMTDFKPGLTVLDVLADMFAGDESDRAQVRQFVKLLKHLARKHHCAILLSHTRALPA